MKTRIQILGISIAAAITFGCASTGDNLQRETARAIGGNISPEQVSVSSIDRGTTSVKWKASAPTGSYECSADDMVRKVLCTKIDQPTAHAAPTTSTTSNDENQASSPKTPTQSTGKPVFTKWTTFDVQQKLVDLGYLHGNPDGKMGKKTIAALKRFQKESGISVTGKPDRETVEIMVRTR